MTLLKNLSVKINFLLLLLLVVSNAELAGQTEKTIQAQISNVLTNAEQVYGPDEVLENGRLYIPDHPKAKGNPYLSDTEWMDGSLIVKGDTYNYVLIKYNVNLEQLILKKTSVGQQSHVPIILNSNFIDSFTTEDRHFVNIGTMSYINELSGFVELIYNGRIIFFIKYNKEFMTQYSQSNQYGAYSKLNSVYYIYENNKLTRLSSKNSFLNYFEPYKKEIKKFMRQKSIRYKKASSAQLFELIKYCDDVSHD